MPGSSCVLGPNPGHPVVANSLPLPSLACFLHFFSSFLILTAEKWPPSPSRGLVALSPFPVESGKNPDAKAMLVAKQTCLLSAIVVLFEATTMSIWTKMGVSSGYNMWRDLLIHCVTCTHGKCLGSKTCLWGSYLLLFSTYVPEMKRKGIKWSDIDVTLQRGLHMQTWESWMGPRLADDWKCTLSTVGSPSAPTTLAT